MFFFPPLSIEIQIQKRTQKKKRKRKEGSSRFQTMDYVIFKRGGLLAFQFFMPPQQE